MILCPDSCYPARISVCLHPVASFHVLYMQLCSICLITQCWPWKLFVLSVCVLTHIFKCKYYNPNYSTLQWNDSSLCSDQTYWQKDKWRLQLRLISISSHSSSAAAMCLEMCKKARKAWHLWECGPSTGVLLESNNYAACVQSPTATNTTISQLPLLLVIQSQGTHTNTHTYRHDYLIDSGEDNCIK